MLTKSTTGRVKILFKTWLILSLKRKEIKMIEKDKYKNVKPIVLTKEEKAGSRNGVQIKPSGAIISRIVLYFLNVVRRKSILK